MRTQVANVPTIHRDPGPARRLADAIAVVFVALWVLRVATGLWTGTLVDQETWVFHVFYGVGTFSFSSLFVLVGWAIVSRQPRNTIGWLLW